MSYVPSGPEEEAFLAAYDPSKFPSTGLAVDMVIFTIRQGRLCVLLIERGGFPFKGSWALPGGFVNPKEDAEAAALRELTEETGLDLNALDVAAYVEQLKTYTAPDRDPRMRVISVAHVAMIPDLPTPEGGDDAADAHWWAVEDLGLESDDPTEDAPELASDHAQIIRDGLERVRSKIEYTPLAVSFLESPFTLADLRRVYETVWNESLHPSNFRRKALSTEGFVVSTGDKGESSTGGRRAALYTAGTAPLLHPAILRKKND